MTDREEFEKWLVKYSRSIEYNRTGWSVMVNRAWQACAEKKNAIIRQCNNQTEHFERLYYLEKDKVEQQAKELEDLAKKYMHAASSCIDIEDENENLANLLLQAETKIKVQAEELAKLLDFNKALFRFNETGISGRALYNAYYDYGLIDDNGSLANLLTGETP